MSHKHLLGLLGSVLVIVGAIERGWGLILIWLGSDFIAIAFAYGKGAHQVFGKRADGTLPLSSWLLFLPFLVYMSAVWHVLRVLSREPARRVITPQLIVGRRLLPWELDTMFDNYVDLTAEFAEPQAVRRSAGYRSFPILDAMAPSPAALREAIRSLRPGRTFVHCAQGHGRTGLFALAMLLTSGEARTVETDCGCFRRFARESN
jgi:hypothetical protein